MKEGKIYKKEEERVMQKELNLAVLYTVIKPIHILILDSEIRLGSSEYKLFDGFDGTRVKDPEAVEEIKKILADLADQIRGHYKKVAQRFKDDEDKALAAQRASEFKNGPKPVEELALIPAPQTQGAQAQSNQNGTIQIINGTASIIKSPANEDRKCVHGKDWNADCQSCDEERLTYSC